MPPSDVSVTKLTELIVDWYIAEWNGGIDPAVKRQNQHALLSLLEEEPTLAAVLIGSETAYDDTSYYSLEYSSAYALAYMVDFGCDLLAIEKVYSMFPESVCKVQSLGSQIPGRPVCCACQKKPIQNDVVIFLANVYPDAVRLNVTDVMEGHSRLALFEALRHGRNQQLASFEVIKTLVDLYPQSGSDRMKGKLLLEELIEHGYDSKCLEFAVSQLSDDIDTLTVRGNTCCTLPKATRVMQRVLQAVQPQLKELSLVPTYSSPDGFVRLLKVLTKGDSHNELLLEKIMLAMPTATTNHHGTLRKLLCAIFSSSPNLQHISVLPSAPLDFRGSFQAMCSDIVLEDVATSLLARNQRVPTVVPIKSLELSGVQVSDVCNFVAFLVSCRAPRVTFHQLALDQQEWDNKATALFDPTVVTNPIEHLELAKCRFASADSLCHMLCDFATFMPHLTTLCVRDPSFGSMNAVEGDTSVDITKPISALLAKQQLKDLRLVYERGCCFFVVDMSTVCRGFLRNNINETLETLHLTVDLKEDQQGRDHLLEVVQNCVSLQEVVIYKNYFCFTKKCHFLASTNWHLNVRTSDEDYVSTIEYHLNLNRFGRAEVRRLNISKEQFVGLLAAANHTLDGLDLFNVNYGLLREASNLWSATPPAPTIPHDNTRRVRRRLT